MNQGFALTGIEDQNGQIALSFDAPGGAKQQRTFDAVILALPFTCLRKVEGLDSLGLSNEKLKCIRKLGMGQHAKIMVGTTSRVWRKPPRSPACLPPMAASFPILRSRIYLGKRATVSSRPRPRPAFSPTSWAAKLA